MRTRWRLALLLALGVGPREGTADSSGPTGPAVVRGTVRVVNPPKRRKIQMDADPAAAAMHAEPVYSEDAVVDAENRIQWAFVYVKSGLEGKVYPTPQEARHLVHEKCLLKPHVLGLQAGQPLKIRNEDALLHNSNAMPVVNRKFNFAMPKKGMEETKSFTKAEEFFRIRCDVHPWEAAWVTVLPHPCFAVTGPDGRYEIRGLPPGEYVLEAWHERYAPVTQKVKVRVGSLLTADWTLTQRK